MCSYINKIFRKQTKLQAICFTDIVIAKTAKNRPLQRCAAFFFGQYTDENNKDLFMPMFNRMWSLIKPCTLVFEIQPSVLITFFDGKIFHK